MLSSSCTATWSCLQTSERRQSSESVGEIVSEETCSFGIRSGFQTFFQTFSKAVFQTSPKSLEKLALEKSLEKNGSAPPSPWCTAHGEWAFEGLALQVGACTMSSNWNVENVYAKYWSNPAKFKDLIREIKQWLGADLRTSTYQYILVHTGTYFNLLCIPQVDGSWAENGHCYRSASWFRLQGRWP